MVSWLVVTLTFAVLGFISLLALDCVLPSLAIALGQGADGEEVSLGDRET